MSLLHKLNRNLELHPTHPLCDALPSFNQLSSFRIRETWRLGKDIIMYPPVQIIPGVVDRRWIRTLKASQGVWHDFLSDSFFVILQVCRHCLPERENCFKQPDKLAGHVNECLHPYCVGL